MSDSRSPPGGDRDPSDSEAFPELDLDTVTVAEPDDGGDDGWFQIAPEESHVPPDREGPVAECPYCDRPFESAHARALHVGEVHPDACTAEERDAYEEADETERDDLFVYHLKAVVAIGLTWAAFVLLYMVAIGSNII